MAKYSTRELSIVIKSPSVNKTISNLNIRVVATKTLSANPNEAIIEIYNLNKNSREDLYNNVYDYSLDQANTKLQVILSDNIIFKGYLINVNNIYMTEAAEWKTILYCGDGFNAFRAKTKKKFEKGTTRNEMIDVLTGELESVGVAVKGVFEGLKECTDKSILKSITIDGEIISNIKKLLKNCFKDVDVYVDDDKINALVDNAIIKNNLIIINDGLIEPPSLSEQGINCKVLLNSSLKIGSEFQVQTKNIISSFANLTTRRPNKNQISGIGTFRLQQLKHTVDNFSSEIAMSELIGLNSGRTNE